jgi:hypothetical protein
VRNMRHGLTHQIRVISAYDIYGIGHHGNKCGFAEDDFDPMDMCEPESSSQHELERDSDGMELCDDY